MNKVLTIAGSDTGAGAGIQADIKTFSAFGVYGTSVITALTAQNTLGVTGILDVPLGFIEKQIDAVMVDISPATWKTGMLVNSETIEVIANKVKQYRIKNLIIDPVLIAKGGDSLLKDGSIDSLKKVMIPLARVIIPNCPEAEFLTGISIRTIDDMKKAAIALYNMGAKNVIIKGGHLSEDMDAIDLCYDGKIFSELLYKRIRSKNTHGTGCTFASAVAAGISKGESFLNASKKAKEYVYGAIVNSIDLGIGRGHGPLDHFYIFKHP